MIRTCRREFTSMAPLALTVTPCKSVKPTRKSLNMSVCVHMCLYEDTDTHRCVYVWVLVPSARVYTKIICNICIYHAKCVYMYIHVCVYCIPKPTLCNGVEPNPWLDSWVSVCISVTAYIHMHVHFNIQWFAIIACSWPCIYLVYSVGIGVNLCIYAYIHIHPHNG